MWADTLLALERGHLQRLLLWAALCLLGGTATLAWVRVRALEAPMLRHFAIQTAAWGAVNAAIVAWAWRGLAYRDYAKAQSLVHMLWLNPPKRYAPLACLPVCSDDVSGCVGSRHLHRFCGPQAGRH